MPSHREKSSNDSSPRSTGPIVVTDEPKRKRLRKKAGKPKKPAPEPKNLFSDETARFFLQLLRGKSDLPDQIPLPGKKKPKSDANPYEVDESAPKRPEKKDVQEELAEAIRQRIFPWLFSFFVHACLLICLALLFFPRNDYSPFDILSGFNEDLTEFIRDNPAGFDAKINDLVIITPQDLPQVDMPRAEPVKAETAETGAEHAVDSENNALPGLSFEGREFGSHPNVLSAGGGTGKTDAAVVAGLNWLKRNQMHDGSWWFSQPYPNAANRNLENRLAATAMALLAFQGYGVTPNTTRPGTAEFARAVRMGWDWLLKQQNLEDDELASGDGVFFRDKAMRNDDRFYTHGLCTIALCELLAMTKEEKYREPARRAVAYCLRHQSVAGGWRYNPDRQSRHSDVSVTGWIVMALKSAEAAGIEVPRDVYDDVMKFLDSVATDGGSQYIYRPQEPGFRIAMNAEGLLCRILLGWKQDDLRLRRGVELLIDPQYMPSFDDHYARDVYHWYYATQTLHHYGGEPWRIWNERMRELLPQQQEQHGANAGSWNPHQPVRDTWGNTYGRLYTTCLSIYILEVYYRHLRVYER